MCGIFGIINNKYTKFDKRYFNMAGIINDARGGDSCGVMIDGAVEYGVDKEKLFSDFRKTSQLIHNTERCRVAIGHTRKASVGAINMSTAQPVCIYNDRGEIDFMLIHNGTIKNYKDLANKYDVKCPDSYTDSMHMAHIIYHHGTAVLGEYIGAAAMVMVDYRKNPLNPDVLLFKGASRQSQYGYNTEKEDERPLFYARDSHNNIYFSSVTNVLYGLVSDTVYTLRENTLMKVGKDGALLSLAEYDRVKCMEDHYDSLGSYRGSSSYSGYGYNSGYGGAGGSSTTTPSFGTKIKVSDIPIYGEKAYRNKVAFSDQGYVIFDTAGNSSCADGIYYLSRYGYRVEKSSEFSEEYCFIDGYYIPSREVYDTIVEMREVYIKEAGGESLAEDTPETRELIEEYIQEFYCTYSDVIEALSYLSFSFRRLRSGGKPGPIRISTKEYFGDRIIQYAYTGEFVPLFEATASVYSVDNGEIVGKKIVRNMTSIEYSKRDLEVEKKSFSTSNVIELFLKSSY